MMKRLFVVLFLSFLIFFSSNAVGQTTELLISEYIEGSGNNKSVEIYNGTGAAVDLSNYRIWRVSNGGIWPEVFISLSGTLADNDVYVVSNTGDVTLESVTVRDDLPDELIP
jgi:predicted extracellular nuclease